MNMSVKIKYIFGRILNLNYKKMFYEIDRVYKRTGRNKIITLFDMVWCGLRYEAGYMDYSVFELYRANEKQRKTFLTRGINDRYVAKLNDENYRHFFSNKDEFNELFADFIGRDWLFIEPQKREEFKKWVKGRDCIIVKPRNGMCGRKIEKIKPSDFESTDSLFDYIVKENLQIAEECITQHEALSALHPASINTVRIVTILKYGKPYVITAWLRVGNGRAVDNFNSHGMVTKIDVGTGKIVYPAVDKDGTVYEKHPVTGVKFAGYQIPNWRESIDMVKKAALIVPKIRYVGWDIAETPNGPVLVEGNEFPGHDLLQMPVHTPDNIGILPEFEKIESYK